MHAVVVRREIQFSEITLPPGSSLTYCAFEEHCTWWVLLLLALVIDFHGNDRYFIFKVAELYTWLALSSRGIQIHIPTFHYPTYIYWWLFLDLPAFRSSSTFFPTSGWDPLDNIAWICLFCALFALISRPYNSSLGIVKTGWEWQELEIKNTNFWCLIASGSGWQK